MTSSPNWEFYESTGQTGFDANLLDHSIKIYQNLIAVWSRVDQVVGYTAIGQSQIVTNLRGMADLATFARVIYLG